MLLTNTFSAKPEIDCPGESARLLEADWIDYDGLLSARTKHRFPVFGGHLVCGPRPPEGPRDKPAWNELRGEWVGTGESTEPTSSRAQAHTAAPATTGGHGELLPARQALRHRQGAALRGVRRPGRPRTRHQLRTSARDPRMAHGGVPSLFIPTQGRVMPSRDHVDLPHAKA